MIMKHGRGRPLVDQLSFNLAEHFLQEDRHTEDETWDLADVIQQAVEGWFGVRETILARRKQAAEIRQVICAEADATDFAIMRWGQRNPRVCASNAPTGEPIHYGGRRQL